MEYKINARVSNRHVHLTKETYYKLFDEDMVKIRDLNQIGQFVSDKEITIKYNDLCIEKVKVLGPLRNYDQIEISKRDARHLGVNPPVRRSGDVENTPSITLITEKGEVTTTGLIIANRHVHMSPSDAIKYNVVDKQIVQIKISGDKSGIIDAEVKVSDDGYYEIHLDTDDANAFLVNDNDVVTMIIE